MTTDNVLEFQTKEAERASTPTTAPNPKQDKYEAMCKELGMLVTDARRINARLQWLEREIDLLIIQKQTSVDERFGGSSIPPGAKYGGRDFVKGHPYLGGHPVKLIPEVEGVPRLDKGSVNRLINKTVSYTKDELKEVHDNPKSTVLEVWLAAIVAKGVQQGCPGRLEALFNRAIGPVPKLIDATLEQNQIYYPPPNIQKIPDDELKKLVVAHLEEGTHEPTQE